MKTKHTPGPWTLTNVEGAGLQIYAKIGAHNFIEYASVSKDTEGMIWQLLSYEPWHQFAQEPWEEMQEANAAIMAAAPELLESLIEIREWYEKNHDRYMGTDTPVCFSKGLSAILKAIPSDEIDLQGMAKDILGQT